MRQVPARAVEVAKYHRAECSLCEWTGNLLDSYQEANSERQAHLEVHRSEDA